MTTTVSREAVLAKVTDFLVELNEKSQAQHEREFKHAYEPVEADKPGPKYLRLFRKSIINPVSGQFQRTCYCFIDLANGDILKADGWKKPAKHARGNIFKGLDGTDKYGASYLK
jgi:hypothetical protein